NHSPFVKDSINDAVTQNRIELINPEKVGTKAAAHYRFTVPPGERASIRLRLTRTDLRSARASRAPVGASPTGFGDKEVRGEAPRQVPFRHRPAGTVATPGGAIFTTSASCRCLIVGNFPGMLHGTSPFIVFPSPWSIRILPKASSIPSCANGISIPTASFPPTNGTSAMLIHPWSGGRPGVSSKSSANKPAKGTAHFLKQSFTNCSLPLPGG